MSLCPRYVASVNQAQVTQANIVNETDGHSRFHFSSFGMIGHINGVTVKF